MTGCLHVVATPIGNLDDITCRAARVLAEVATIAAEDTRRTTILLRHLGVPTEKLLALHEHNEAQATERLLTRLRSGVDVALVADAGLPLIADPGFALVRRCWEQGIAVLPSPGVSALTTLLSVCPLAADRVRFVGFLPAKAATRQRALEALCRSASAALFFEAPHRIEVSLVEISEFAPQRRLFIGREMTKQHEAYYCGDASTLLAELRSTDAIRGEFSCLLESRREAPRDGDLDGDHLLAALVKELPPSRAARVMAEVFGGGKGDYYHQAISASGKDR